MEISNIPLPIGKNRTIGAIGADIHHLLKFRVIGQFGTGITLNQSLNWVPVDFCRHPLSIF